MYSRWLCRRVSVGILCNRSSPNPKKAHRAALLNHL